MEGENAYHGVDTVDFGRCAAASIVHQTLVDVAAIVAIPDETRGARVTEERARGIATVDPGVHGAGSLASPAFVHVFHAGWITAIGLPTLGE